MTTMMMCVCLHVEIEQFHYGYFRYISFTLADIEKIDKLSYCFPRVSEK
jgi:hypothetical protein